MTMYSTTGKTARIAIGALVAFVLILQSCSDGRPVQPEYQYLGDGVGDGYLRITVRADEAPTPTAFYSEGLGRVDVFISEGKDGLADDAKTLPVSVHERKDEGVYFVDVAMEEPSFDLYVDLKARGRWTRSK